MVPTRRAVAGAALALLAISAGACGDGDAGGPAGGERHKIALLLPEAQTTRYESFDRPLFEAKVKQLCAECDVVYKNANSDKALQQSQAEAAIAEGVDVLVFDAQDAASAGTLVDKAKLKNIPVIAYDRLIANADLDADKFYTPADICTGEFAAACTAAGIA